MKPDPSMTRDIDCADSPVDLAQIERQAIYRVACLSSNAGLLVQAMNGTIIWANDAYGRIMGQDPKEIIGRNPLSFALPLDETPPPEAIAKFQFIKPVEDRPYVEVHRNRRGDGKEIWIELQVTFDSIRGFGDVAIMAVRDISDHIARQDKIISTSADLRRLAATDSITRLANRHEVMRHLESTLESQSVQDTMVGLMNIDLDHFKDINDNFGHAAGDAILVHLAQTLQDVLGRNEIAGRIGGDEFVIISKSVASLDQFAQLGARLISRFSRPFNCDGVTLEPSLSIGAAVAPIVGVSPDTLLKHADIALYKAKDDGRGRFALYDRALHEQQKKADLLATEVKIAIFERNLTFMFQPSMRLSDGQIQGFETLVRWNHPRLGLISPGDFLPVVRNMGLMAALDDAALDAAIKLAGQLDAAGFSSQTVSFNASAELLSQKDFAETFLSRLKANDVAPDRIVVEVLETVVLEIKGANDVFAGVIHTLTQNGVRVLLDDFGTGHAGLTHLAKLAVSGVKIDRSLTENILTDGPSAKIIAMMHDLCHDLGMAVVTEGIETTEQAAALQALGGRVLQGYWLAKAMPADAAITWLEAQKLKPHVLDATAIADTQNRRYLRANLS